MGAAERRVPTAAGRLLAAAAAFVTLLAVYVATLAPTVTFWDAGEFVAAVHTLGVPHPPGTPLYVLAARAFGDVLPLLPRVVEVNLFSAVCTAAAGAVSAALVARWLGGLSAGFAAALCAGSMSTVWSNATEAEVYAPALLLAVAMLAAADRAGRSGDARWLALVAYLVALTVPLHLTALVAAPAAALLAGMGPDGRLRLPDVVLLGGVTLAVAGVSRASAWLVGLGAAVLLAGVAARARGGAPARGAAAGIALRTLAAVVLGLSVLAFMLVRARHDPGVNQGDPSTWQRALEVVARRQYAVAGLWPRQAPWWIQLANVFEWADWQVALGLAPGVAPHWLRTPFTVLFAALGLLGASVHRRLDRRSWRAMTLLILCTSVGVVAYLNLKAGPSFGHGVLPDTAPHESRERDYFFAVAFWTWGLWAGVGALALGARVRRAPIWAGLALAALPVALNWGAVSRRREPQAHLARTLARVLLAQAPPRAVMLVNGDNDTYTVWYLQHVEGVRRDVTPVTVPLLGAEWYRAELARRDSLLGADHVRTWRGLTGTIRAIADRAAAQGRPVAASVILEPNQRAAAGRAWTLLGALYVREPATAVRVPVRTDAPAAARIAATLPASLFTPLGEAIDGAPAWSQRMLRCPQLAAERTPAAGTAALLDSTCNRR